MKVALCSDWHIGLTSPQTIRKLLKKLYAEKPDLIIHAGDYCGGLNGPKSVNTIMRFTRELCPDIPAIATIGNHDCISEDTEILSDSGWKNINNLSEGDLVATMNTSKQLEWQPVQRKIVRDYDPKVEDMYIYENTIDMAVTANHRIYTTDRSGNEVNVKIAFFCSNDFSVINGIDSKTSVPLTDEEIKLAAWLCTDSHIGKKCGNITFYQRESNVHKITDLLDNLRIPYKKRTRIRDIKQIQGKVLESVQPSVEVHMGAEDSIALLLRLSVVSNKQLPIWYKELSNEQWNTFLEALVDADGTKKKDSKWAVFYGRKEICEEVQIGASLHGWRASLTEYRANQWRVNLSPQRVTRIVGFKNSATKNYSGKVWCITVDNGNFLCRRNNKVHLTGNCWSKTPTLQSFWEAYGPYSLTAKYMKRWDIHFLDEDGPYVHTDFPHVGFVGGMGWYYSPDVSNNKKYICQDILGDTQRFLCRDFEDKSLKYLDELAENPIVTTKVFVSHFPIIEPNEDDLKWGGNFKFGDFIQKEYGIDYFFNGHMHANNNGPVRFEAGSDYGKPKYKIIEV